MKLQVSEKIEALGKKGDTEGLSHIIKEAKKNIVKNSLLLGFTIDVVDRHGIFIDYDGWCNSLDDFLEAVDIPRSTGRHYMNIWREFGELMLANALDLPVRRAIKLLPVAKNKDKETKVEWLEKASHLKDKQLEEEIREAQGKPTYETCNHKWKSFRHCSKCNSWEPIDNES